MSVLGGNFWIFLTIFGYFCQKVVGFWQEMDHFWVTFDNFWYGFDSFWSTSGFWLLTISVDFCIFLTKRETTDFTDYTDFWQAFACFSRRGKVKIGKLGKMLILNNEFSIFNEFWSSNFEWRYFDTDPPKADGEVPRINGDLMVLKGAGITNRTVFIKIQIR